MNPQLPALETDGPSTNHVEANDIISSSRFKSIKFGISFSDLKKGDESPQFDASSAFLGPNLWDKTFGEEDLKFEYMDFDEFLTENGLHTNIDDQLTVKVNENSSNHGNRNTEPSNHSPVLSPNHHGVIPHSPSCPTAPNGPCSPQLTQLGTAPNPYLLMSHSHSHPSQQALSPMPSPTIPHPSSGQYNNHKYNNLLGSCHKVKKNKS